MAKISREYRDMAEKVFAEFGCTTFSFDTASKHPVIHFSNGAKSMKQFVPGSASDHRSFMNCRSQLRNMLKQLGFEKVKK